jgi:murein DD-endopeptidase MepM/ murein hydrolase activator NlpD
LPALARPQIRSPDPVTQEPVIQEPERSAPRVRFAWPAKGKLLVRFGPRPDGKRSDGIDIDVAQGAPVRAAAPGMVVYAGDDLPGYGNLVLLKHEGGWVTAYARTRRIVAREGAKVAQGDVIAEAGGPVHFQIRRGAEPADPLGALPPV